MARRNKWGIVVLASVASLVVWGLVRRSDPDPDPDPGPRTPDPVPDYDSIIPDGTPVVNLRPEGEGWVDEFGDVYGTDASGVVMCPGDAVSVWWEGKDYYFYLFGYEHMDTNLVELPDGSSILELVARESFVLGKGLKTKILFFRPTGQAGDFGNDLSLVPAPSSSCESRSP